MEHSTQKRILLMVAHSSELTGGGEENFDRLLDYFSNYFTIYSLIPYGPRQEEYAGKSDKFILSKNYIFPFSKFSLMGYIRFFYHSIKKIYLLSKFIKNNRNIDICFLNSSVSFLEIIPLKIFRIPFVIYIREKINPPIVRKLIYFFIKRTAKVVLTNSAYIKELFKGTSDANNIVVVYSTIDEEKIKDIKSKIIEKVSYSDSSDFVITNIGTINPLKNQFILLKAIKELNIDNIKVNFIGKVTNDDYMQMLVEYVKENCLTQNVSFLGEVSKEEIAQNIFNSDTLVITSKEEGFSLVLLEGLFLGVPIITTSVGVVPEVIKDKENGLIYSSDNSRQLSECILYLMSNTELKNKLKKASLDTYSRNFGRDESSNK